jgi:ferric-dicitrate binding protein FerR (iron transport regulator)
MPAEERQALLDVWDALGEAEPSTGDDPVDDAFESVLRRIEGGEGGAEGGGEHAPAGRPANGRADRAPSRPARKRSRSGARRWAAAAVVVLLLVALGTWAWRQPVSVSAPRGGQATATLPDGSTVDLNSGTTLRYRRGFQAWPFVDASRRRVRLDGEAFFDVRDGGRPFVVATPTARVQVVGTRFYVRTAASPEDSSEAASTEVTVASGEVRVEASDRPDRPVSLREPGETTRVTAPSDPPSPPVHADVERMSAWRAQGFTVRNRSLRHVLNRLERRYDVSIQLHPTVDSLDPPLSLYYPEATNVETILHDICLLAQDLHYRRTSSGYEVLPDTLSR